MKTFIKYRFEEDILLNETDYSFDLPVEMLQLSVKSLTTVINWPENEKEKFIKDLFQDFYMGYKEMDGHSILTMYICSTKQFARKKNKLSKNFQYFCDISRRIIIEIDPDSREPIDQLREDLIIKAYYFY